jgi:hypothetical protein
MNDDTDDIFGEMPSYCMLKILVVIIYGNFCMLLKYTVCVCVYIYLFSFQSASH